MHANTKGIASWCVLLHCFALSAVSGPEWTSIWETAVTKRQKDVVKFFYMLKMKQIIIKTWFAVIWSVYRSFWDTLYFLAQFENCSNSVDSPKVKLSLLKGFLTGYKSQLILNYDEVINLLKQNFLDVSFIIDEIFKQILNYSPKFDPDFVNVRKFLLGVKADWSELTLTFTEITPNPSLLVVTS